MKSAFIFRTAIGASLLSLAVACSKDDDHKGSSPSTGGEGGSSSNTGGSPGNAGRSGDTGGTPGAPGGSPGAAGTAGTAGTPGGAGTPTAGTPSTAGTPGTAGTPSTAGSPGTAGQPATAGSPGDAGNAGTPGTAGSPGTAGGAGGAGAMACQPACGTDEFCANGTCVRGGAHAEYSQLAGPFATGPEVTAQCITCHNDAANHVLASAHWRWEGPTPALEGHTTGADIGKKNLINNFCVAVATNEARCTQCHNGYGWANDSFDFDDPANIDCLSCHAAPDSGYAKDPKTAGNPAATVDLSVAARSVGATTTGNCGSCHFKAGGGNNVKNGALGAALATATPDLDVHLGGGMGCSTCHDAIDHQFPGTSVYTSVVEGRVYCEDCHTDAPHGDATLDNHALDVACQTCHIPSFAKADATKVDWDWSTAGNRTIGDEGVETTTLPDGTTVTAYDAMKGNFVWQKDVVPTYAWYDGGGTHLTIDPTDTYGTQGSSADNPVVIAAPNADYDTAAAKIHPFKVMTGRQPGHATGRYLLVPKLFGPGGFWGAIPTSADYTPATVTALWEAALTAGAVGSGQIADTESITTADVEWVYTEMYLNIDHEVVPVTEALGCGDCHGGGRLDWTALGYGCDPSDGACSASRNP